MRWRSASLALAVLLVGTGGSVAGAADRFEDALGDATGDAPDIVAVTVDEPQGESTLRFAIDVAPERPFGSDMETWSDVVFFILSDVPTVDERGILEGGFTTGVHGVNLAAQEQAGALLSTMDDLWWYVVDVDSDEDTLTFTFDRKLIGSPTDLYWQVLMGVERFDGSDEGDEMEGDTYPEFDQPPAHYKVIAAGY